MDKNLKRVKGLAFADQANRTFIFNNINLFLIKLGINSTLLGLANTIFNFFYALSKLTIPKIIEIYKNKKILIIFFKIIATILLTILIFTKSNLYLSITLFSLIFLIDGFIIVTRDSLYTDLYDKKDVFYSKLLFYAGIGALFSLIITNILFYLLPEKIITIKIIFTIAIFFEIISIYFLSKIKYKEIYVKKRSFMEHIEKLRKNKDYVYVLLGYSFFYFGLMFVSPFIVDYIINYLKASFFFFALFNMFFFIFYDLAQRFWGKVSKYINERQILIIGSVIVSIFPILFLAWENKIYLLAIQILIGFGFAALTFSLFSYLVLLADHDEKPYYLGIFYSLTSIPAIFAPFLGGYLLNLFSQNFSLKTSYWLIFLISFGIRIIGTIIYTKTKPLPYHNISTHFILFKVKKMFLKRHS